MKIVKKNKKTTAFILVIIAIFLVIAGIGAYFIFFNKPNNFEGTAGVSKVNYNPPTEEEKQAGNDQKQEVVKQDELDKKGTTNKTADVFISDASFYSENNMVEVRAYIANVYEEGGQCTATFTQGAQSVTQSSTGFKDARTTQCGAINIPRSKFPTAGTWNLTLIYKSSTAEGSKTASIKL